MVVEKAVKMAEKMAVPIVGLVENMSSRQCTRLRSDSACATRPSASMRPLWRLSNKSLRRKPQAQSIFS